MVKGPGRVILAGWSVLARRNCMSRTSTGPRAPDLADDARHRRLLARARLTSPGLLDVDALERRGEVVGVAFAAHLAVGDDVDAGALHVADGEQRGVVLRLLQVWLGHIEFEYESRNFLRHLHDPSQCDIIVCWKHNWPECPLEVIELSKIGGES